MVRRRIMVAGGHHLRLARMAPPPLRCTSGLRLVGSTGQSHSLWFLQDWEPGDVRDAACVDVASSTISAPAECSLGTEPPPWSPPSSDPPQDGTPLKKDHSLWGQARATEAGHVDGGSTTTPASFIFLAQPPRCCPHADAAKRKYAAGLSQDQTRRSLHGLPEPDGVRGAAWVEGSSSSPPTAACCPALALAPRLWIPSNGGVPWGKGCLPPQAQAKHTIHALPELDNVQESGRILRPWRQLIFSDRGLLPRLYTQARASTSRPSAAGERCLVQLVAPSSQSEAHARDVLPEPDDEARPAWPSRLQLAPVQLCSHTLAAQLHARTAQTMFGAQMCSQTLIRSYSTSSTPPTMFISLERPRPPIKVKKFGITVGDSELLMKQLKSDHSSCVQELMEDDLKSEYFRSVRPFLVSCCLVCAPGHLDHPDAGLLYSTNKHFISKDPNYLTSLDLMRKLKLFYKGNWGHLLQYIRDNRVMVVENWTTSLGSIEVCVYDHGLSGPPGDAQYYRGQSDASIQCNKATYNSRKPAQASEFDTKPGTDLKENEKHASLCTLIWKGHQVKDCQVFRRVPCSSKITRAEMLAMFALARRGFEMSIKKFSVITDCQEVDRNNRGVGLVEKNDKNSDVRLAIRYLIGFYESFISRWETRVKNMFPDSILKEDDESGGDHNIDLLLEKWEHHLSGLPLFKIHQNEDKIRKRIFDASGKGLRQFEKEWKLNVKGEDAKFEALFNIVQSLSPPYVLVHVKDEDCAYVIRDHAPKFSNRYNYKAAVYKVKQGYMVTLTPGLLSPGRKHLRLMYDASLEVPDLGDLKLGLVGNGLKVTLITPEDKQLVFYKEELPEVSPICFLFFGTYDRRYGKVKWN